MSTSVGMPVILKTHAHGIKTHNKASASARRQQGIDFSLDSKSISVWCQMQRDIMQLFQRTLRNGIETCASTASVNHKQVMGAVRAIIGQSQWSRTHTPVVMPPCHKTQSLRERSTRVVVHFKNMTIRNARKLIKYHGNSSTGGAARNNGAGAVRNADAESSRCLA